jgi:hypothetical protein
MVDVTRTKNYNNNNQVKNTTRKTNHKKWKSKFNPRLETQSCKAKTRYMLEDDLNKKIF